MLHPVFLPSLPRMQARLSRSSANPYPLSGTVLCTSGLPNAAAYKEAEETATRFGAQMTKVLTRSVTHLLCVAAGSEKHRTACAWNQSLPVDGTPIVIVRPSWLDATAREGAMASVVAHALPPLAGLQICCSGIELEEKGQIQQICMANDALYSKSLIPTCTHLICGEASGKKYKYACESDTIQIVNKEWIYECNRLRLLVDERDFPLEGHVSEESPDAIVEEQIAEAEGNEKRPEDDGRMAVDVVKPSKRAVGKKSANTIEQHSPLPQTSTPTSTKRTKPSVAAANLAQQPEPDPNVQAPVPSSNTLNQLKASFILDPFTFYLTPSPLEHKASHTPLLARAFNLIAHGGGSISEQISPRVNYIIIIHIPVSRSKVPAIDAAQKLGALILPLSWLENSIREGILLPHEQLPRAQWAVQDTIPQDESTLVGSLPSAEVNSKLFQGLRCALGPLALYDNGLVAKTAYKLQRARGKVLQHDERGVVTSGVATHVICGDSLPAGSKRLIDHAVEQNRYVVIVTTAWIDTCLNEETLFQPEECMLFRPIGHETPLRDMQLAQVNITISGHQLLNDPCLNRRRDVLSRLARMLGATYSERMKRNRTTHLIADGRALGKSGKIEKAKIWGIAIVSYKWLLACAQEGCLVNAADYPFEELPKDNAMEGHLGPEEGEDGDDKLFDDEIEPGKAGDTENVTPKRETFQVPKIQRRSPRLKQTDDVGERAVKDEENGALVPKSGEDKIQMFKRFTDGLQLTQMGVATDEAIAAKKRVRRRSGRSRSVSLDAPEIGDDREWSLDASQSQVIQHRDLTPPPTPVTRRRSMPHRAAKRGRR